MRAIQTNPRFTSHLLAPLAQGNAGHFQLAYLIDSWREMTSIQPTSLNLNNFTSAQTSTTANSPPLSSHPISHRSRHIYVLTYLASHIHLTRIHGSVSTILDRSATNSAATLPSLLTVIVMAVDDPNPPAAVSPEQPRPRKKQQRGILPPELLEVLVPSLKVGASTGAIGVFGGVAAGIVRDAPPALFAVASGLQCFTLGSTYWCKLNDNYPLLLVLEAYDPSQYHGPSSCVA